MFGVNKSIARLERALRIAAELTSRLSARRMPAYSPYGTQIFLDVTVQGDKGKKAVA
jgi:hypothetical protein